MVNVVIFGTGSNGQRAWQAAAARADVRVVCFADNDPRRQGTELHGRRVIAPSALGAEQWDRIVVASMFGPEIKRQLLDAGIPADAIVTPGVAQFPRAFADLAAEVHRRRPVSLDDGTTVAAADLPEILILTAETLNSTHGTGVLLQRFFRDFPAEKLFGLSHTDTGAAWLRHAASVSGDPRDWPAAVAAALDARAFAPRLVYATAFNETDLDLLASVLDVLPATVPVVQHFMDYMPHDPAAFDGRFRRLSPRIAAVWAIADGMARELTARYERQVALVTALHQEPPPQFKDVHRAADAGFRTAMLGNLWQPEMLPVIQRVWQRCRERLTDLAPIDWYVHPSRAQGLIDAGYELDEHVRWAGFHNGAALQARLRSADLGIVPFNVTEHAGDGYTRYSLPSRLTELCGAGLPIVAIASADTEPARFLARHGCGVIATGPDEESIAAQVMSIVGDRDLRTRLGRRARQLAETELDAGAFERHLVGTFVRLACPPAAARRSAGLVPLAGVPAAGAQAPAPLTDRVHYACGRNVLAGWVNVDGFEQSFPAGELPSDVSGIWRADLTETHPFPDGQFVLGYAEDFIEHIDQAELTAFLCEAYRTFRPGGVLRLSTPGLAGILQRHLRGADREAVNVFRDEAYAHWCHEHYVCFEELETIARHVGWRDVRRCEYGRSSVPDLALESRPTQADLNLVVELIK